MPRCSRPNRRPAEAIRCWPNPEESNNLIGPHGLQECADQAVVVLCSLCLELGNAGLSECNFLPFTAALHENASETVVATRVLTFVCTLYLHGVCSNRRVSVHSDLYVAGIDGFELYVPIF